MKKILGISLCALFAVSAANAEIASKAYVDGLVGGIDTNAIATNTSNISALTTRVSTNETNIQTNADDIDALEGRVSTNETDIDNLQGSVAGLKALARKDTVASGDIDNGTITNDDISGTAAIATTKIAFTDAQKNALNSTIDSTKVAQIATNTGNIATNTADIATNTANIATNTSNISTLNGSMTALTGRVNTNEQGIATNANAISGINNTIEGLELIETTGNYVRVVSQAGGQVSATPGSFESELDSGTIDNAPTSKAVANYVADNAIQSVRSGTNNGTIIVDETAVSVAGLKALAYKDKVAAGDINPGAIVDADISESARIATGKIGFSDAEKAALGSTITAAKVGQIETNTDSIGDIQDFLDTMINEAPGYADCKSTADGCTLVLSNTGYKWEEVKR